jgi:tetratricopeptide (TPR) repeat protein
MPKDNPAKVYAFANNLIGFGDLCSKNHNYEDAESKYIECLDLYQGIYNNDIDYYINKKIAEPEMASACSDYIDSLMRVGRFYRDWNKFEKSEEYFKKVIEISGPQIDIANRWTKSDFIEYFTDSLIELSDLLIIQHRANEVEDKLCEVLSNREYIECRFKLISALLMQDKFEKADESIDIIKNENRWVNRLLEDWDKFEKMGLFTDKQKEYINKKREELKYLTTK